MANTIAGAMMPKKEHTESITVIPRHDENEIINTVQWMGTKDVRVVASPKPLVTDPGDVVIKVTSSCICGSDLHLYLGAMPGMKKGDILGHETMGIVVDAGPEVTSVRPGDRVVVAFEIACGHCFSCKHQDFSGCDTTNPSVEQEMLYQHRTAGLFGYSHLTGGYEGGQAEYLRVPLADQNTLKLPPADVFPDERAVLLSDILPTAWHANELGEVQQGDTVAIWGAGPVGILAAHVAQVRGAQRVVLIDKEQYRLDFAKQRMPDVTTINFQGELIYFLFYLVCRSSMGVPLRFE